MVQTWIRMAGIALVFSGSIIWGISLEYQMKRRWILLQNMCEILCYLKQEMMCHRTPLDEALQMAARMENGEIAQMMRQAAKQMQKRNGRAFQEIWQEAAGEAFENGVLEQQELDVISESWIAFCSPDVTLQKNMFEQQIARMELQMQSARQQYREKAGLYRRLGAIGGACLIILLL